MKKIEVVAAIIIKDNKILATCRGYGDFQGMWEFPGGKIEQDESKADAILREIQEELAVTIQIERILTTVDYDYPTFHLTMHCFISSIKEGTITLLEHSNAKWLELAQLDSVEWLPADVEVVEEMRRVLG